MTFTVGLVGLGRVGAQYDRDSLGVMSHLRAILENKSFILRFAYDPCLDSCELVREIYALDNVFSEITDALHGVSTLDLLVVASPTEHHLESMISILPRVTTRMVLCEKPLGSHLVMARQIVDICASHGAALFTNYMRRSLPAVKQLKGLIQSEPSDHYDVVVKYSGCFRNNGSHFLDLVNYFFSPPEKIVWSEATKCIDAQKLSVQAVVKHRNAIVNYIPLRSTDVVEHEVEIMSDNYKIVMGRAGRDIFVLNAIPDPDFAANNTYGDAVPIDSDYLMFQKHVYNDVLEALSSGLASDTLCDAGSSLIVECLLEDLIGRNEHG